jgi:phosphatidylglycerophosphate synthase
MSEAPAQVGQTQGVVVLASTPEAGHLVAGLDPLLRHCLALQAAGAQRIYLIGASTEPPRDERLRVEVLSGLPADASADDRFVVLHTDWTTHRTLPTRLAALDLPADGTLGIEGKDVNGPGIFVTRVSQLVALTDALLADEAPEAELKPARPGEFVLPARNAAECRSALPLHLRSLIKAEGGLFDRKIYRHFSLRLTRLLLPTPVTPNAVTWLSFFLALSGAFLVAGADTTLQLVGIAMVFSVRIVDCVDGELARIRYEGSAFGQFLDTVTDGIGVASLMAAVTYRARDLEPTWMYIGVAGVALYLIVELLQLSLARNATGGNSIQDVEWAFLKEDATGLERLIGMIHNFIRIDFIVPFYLTLIALGHLQALLVIHLIASTGGAIYLATQVPSKLSARSS